MKKNFILKTLVLTLSISLFSSFNMGNFNNASAATTEPEIVASSAITMDLETGEVIYCKDADVQHYPASTTKLLTGLLLAENKQKSDQLVYTEDAKAQPAYSLDDSFMGGSMQIGDKISADDIMKGLLLFSGNDTAYVISDNVAGNAENFAAMMNAKAKELGANSSNFVTPNGLHDDNHYTTAYDLSLITSAAYENEWERNVMSLPEASIYINGAKVMIENRNLTLGQNGNIGGKTGYTSLAGGCLATVYERDGRKLIGVVLKSTQVDNEDMTKFNDMDAIMNYSYGAQKEVYKSSGEEVGNASVEYKSFGFFGPKKTVNVPIRLAQDVTYYKNSINDAESKITYIGNDSTAWNLLFNKDVNLTYTTRNHSENVAGTVDISFGTIMKDNILLYIGTLVGIIIIISLIFMLKSLSSNRRKKRSSYRRGRRR
ncbi:MAG: D-alanyl-D-alanine carboxypeptidase [Clostridium butyricum]|nr:D-alanyl-D-alanine carboxypeptidase [Clostridium butyricum]